MSIQKQDYFNLSSIGLTSSGGIAPTPSVVANPATQAYYITNYQGTEVTVGYSFLYWNGVAFPNPLNSTNGGSSSSALEYYGAIAINDMVMVVDNLSISNNSTDTITVDVISASPANVLSSQGVPIIPPSLIKRIVVADSDTITLSDLDLKLPLHSNISSTVPNTTNTEFMSGYGVGVAFPQSATATTATTYSIDYVTVAGVAHFERD